MPAKPYVGLLATAAQLALASTLVVYPPVTTKSTSKDVIKGADAALRYLHCVRDTIAGPGYKNIKVAFAFSHGRRRKPGAGSPLSSPASSHAFHAEHVNNIAANAKSLWTCADDFWHVVGWAFNCSVVHKARWARWRLWLDIMLHFLEAEWDGCIKSTDPESEEREVILQDTILWRYVASQDPTVGNTQKRVLKAILAAGDAKALKEFPEIWDKETTRPKQKDKQKEHGQSFSFDTDTIGDSESDGEDVPMRDGLQSAVKGRRSKRNAPETSDTALSPLEGALISDHEAAITRLGGIEAVDLRQRLLALVCSLPQISNLSNRVKLVKVARQLPKHFTSTEGLFDTLTIPVKYFPAPVLHVLTTTSRLLPDEQLALNTTLATTLASTKYTIYTDSPPTQPELEESLLPLSSGKYDITASAKISLLLEQVVMSMIDKDLLETNQSLRDAVEDGIEQRIGVKARKNKTDEEDQSKVLLERSSERLRGLLELLNTATDKAPIRKSPRKNKLSIRESPRKKGRFLS